MRIARCPIKRPFLGTTLRHVLLPPNCLGRPRRSVGTRVANSCRPEPRLQASSRRSDPGVQVYASLCCLAAGFRLIRFRSIWLTFGDYFIVRGADRFAFGERRGGVVAKLDDAVFAREQRVVNGRDVLAPCPPLVESLRCHAVKGCRKPVAGRPIAKHRHEPCCWTLQDSPIRSNRCRTRLSLVRAQPPYVGGL